MAEWQGAEIKIPAKDVLESTRGTLETLVTFLEVVKAILETVQVFLVDFGNPLRAVVTALLKLIESAISSLKQTGLFAYLDIPDPIEDPNFRMNAGGFPAFVQRFKASLFDGRDPNRPQPAAGSTKSGFVIIVADAETVIGLVRLMKILLQFFGKDFLSPQYPAPANVKVVQVGASGDRLLRVASVFTDPPKALSVEWSLPTTGRQPDPSFEGLIAAAGVEFIPPKFLVERSTVNGGVPIEVEVETSFENKAGVALKQKTVAIDEHGDTFRLFERYTVIDPSHETATFLLGQLGTFRYIDTDVEANKTYYYRVRTFSGKLDIKPDGTLNVDPTKVEIDVPTGRKILKWPGADAADPPVLGRPTTTIAGRIPTIPVKFDVVTLLEQLFKTAFALGFHEALGAGATFDSTTGDPTGGTDPTQVGRGSLQDLAGPLSAFVPVAPAGTPPKDLVTGQYPELPFQFTSVEFYSAVLAQQVSSQMLGVTGIDALGGFRSMMEGPLPYAMPTKKGYLKDATNLTQIVQGFTFTRPGFPELFDATVYETFAFGFSDVALRKNVLSAISYVKSFAFHGTGRNWISISVLRDIIPWSGQFIYELLNRIDGLLEAFKGAESEISDFINLIARKIEVLEKFLSFLIQILNFLDAFSAGYFILKVPSTDGGIADWVKQIDTAGGVKPSSGPQGYTGGVALAYAGPNIDAYIAAFSLLF
jgi:hypothetical protein